MTCRGDLTWGQGSLVVIGLLLALAAVGLVLDCVRAQRRYSREYRINPMYRVGGDVKERS